MADITTKAGLALFTDMEPMDMWESNGVTPKDIALVEAEAVRGERARLAAAVRGLPFWESDYEQGEMDIRRADVLALLEGADA